MANWLHNAHAQAGAHHQHPARRTYPPRVGDTLARARQIRHHRQAPAIARASSCDRQRAEEHHRPRLAPSPRCETSSATSNAAAPSGRDAWSHRPGRLPKAPTNSSSRFRTGNVRTAASLPDNRPLVIDAKFPLEAVTVLRERRLRTNEAAAPHRAQTSWQSHRRHCGEISDPGRDPGNGADVRAVGVGLCRSARRFRRFLQKAYRASVVDRIAVVVDARDPGDPADPEGCADARGRRSDPDRGRPTDGGRRSGCASASASWSSISASERRHEQILTRRTKIDEARRRRSIEGSEFRRTRTAEPARDVSSFPGAA